MKIAHLTSVHQPLDVRILYKEAVTLAAAGHEVVLVAAGGRDTMVQGVRIRSVGRGASRRQRMTTTVLAVLRAALAERADVYHFHDPELIPAGFLLKAMGKRVIYDVHEDLPAQVLSKTWIRPWLRGPVARAVGALERMGAGLFDGVIVANPPHRGRFPQGKTEVVRNLPILEEFADGASAPYAARAPAVVYVGDLTRTRGAEEMVRAIALVPEELEARLWLAGRFSEPGLEMACRALAGWSRVDFLGWQSRLEVAALLQKARVGLVLLHPTAQYRTPYPVKLFEYMAASLPVVASDLPPSRELIEEAGCGLLVPPLDPAAAAQAVQWLLDHPDEAEEMARRGRQAVLERFNWASEGQKLVRYYEQFRDPDGSSSHARPRPLGSPDVR
jgi:glycosyltransferase involved in cell wall biosynthesis